MGFFKDFFSTKEEIWEGEDVDIYEKNCSALKDAGIKIQAFKLNTQMEGCSGECASCSTCMELNIEARSTEDKPVGNDRYAIYVKADDVARAKEYLVEAV
ncbi:MAG: hypothetical protein K6E13_06420 [Lachnospiraceae bacterium]|nr:hypothetical protein [Lachnospiraceae bacterium]